MKKLFWCLFVIMIMLLPIAALAEGDMPGRLAFAHDGRI